MFVEIVTDENYSNQVEHSFVPVLIDFFATWCGPCRMLAPVLEEIAAEAEGKYKICKVDTDQSPGLTKRFEIMGVPTLIVVKNGEISARAMGVQSKSAILELLEK